MLNASPIPRHLTDAAQVIERFADAPGLKLRLSTAAGTSFGVHYATFEEGGPLLPGFPGAISISQGGGASLPVFDLSIHGYDAVAAGFRPDGVRTSHHWACAHCGANQAEVSVTLMYNNWDEDDFQSAPEPPEDCFDWITIDLTCAACGEETVGFLEHECA